MKNNIINNFKYYPLFVLFTFFIYSSSSDAYQVKPMSKEIKPLGRESQYSLRVDNTDSTPLALEFIPWKVAQDEYGKSTLTPADDDLLIIPMSAIIEPGKSQTIMVRYLGEPVLTESQMYSIEVSQVSVALENTKETELGIVFNFKTLLNVVPDNSFAELKAQSLQKKDGFWDLKVINSGNRFAKLSETEWAVTDGKNSIFLDRVNITEYVKGKLILPNAFRIFEVKQLDNIDMDKATVEIKWQKN